MIDNEFMTKFNNLYPFHRNQIDAAYVNSLVELVTACRKWNVEIDKVFAYENGWQVTFFGQEGDAICHDGSYGSPCYGGTYNESVHTNDWSRAGEWETMGFPWDGNDVSVHDAEWLAHEINLLQRGYVWHGNDEQ